jgi:hypothetical protein
MQFHVEALFTHDAGGDLVRVNEPDGARAPRFFVGRTSEGTMRRFRHDIGPDIREELEVALQSDVIRKPTFDLPIDPSPYKTILDGSGAVRSVWVGPAFYFPQELPASSHATRITVANANMLHPHLSAWIADVQLCQPMLAITVDGQAVSLCCSVRRTNKAHEAGVETTPGHRGRGYAADVVTAWAGAVREMNRVPLYSTSWTNEQSLAVARKIALILFGSDLHLT